MAKVIVKNAPQPTYPLLRNIPKGSVFAFINDLDRKDNIYYIKAAQGITNLENGFYYSLPWEQLENLTVKVFDTIELS